MSQYINQPTHLPGQVRHTESMCRGNGINLGSPEIQGAQTQPLGGLPPAVPVQQPGTRTITDKNVGHTKP